MRTDRFISVVLALADLTYDSFKIGLVKNGSILWFSTARLAKQLEKANFGTKSMIPPPFHKNAGVAFQSALCAWKSSLNKRKRSLNLEMKSTWPFCGVIRSVKRMWGWSTISFVGYQITWGVPWSSGISAICRVPGARKIKTFCHVAASVRK